MEQGCTVGRMPRSPQSCSHGVLPSRPPEAEIIVTNAESSTVTTEWQKTMPTKQLSCEASMNMCILAPTLQRRSGARVTLAVSQGPGSL